MTQRDGMEREAGGRFRMGNTCTPVADACLCMVKPMQYCKVNNNNKRKKKKRERERKLHELVLDREAWCFPVHWVTKGWE